MSTSPKGNEGIRAGVPAGEPLTCPKCHGPLQARSAAVPLQSRGKKPPPLLLRLLVFVLLLAALAAPLVAGYHRRSQVVDKASASARQFLDYVHAKKTEAATGMMTVAATHQIGWDALRSILENDRSRYEITSASLNGELVDVMVTCIAPDDLKLPYLPIEVDKNPRAALSMDREADGQWRVSAVAFQPKPGTNSVPNYKLTKSRPVGGGGGPDLKAGAGEPQKAKKSGSKNGESKKKD
jgi:hypothetical protein